MTDLGSERMPAVPAHRAILACAERAVAAIQGRPEAQRSREPLAHAIGDAMGLAVLANDETKARELGRDLKKVLHLAPQTIVRPAVTRTLLNSPGHLLGTARMGTDPERSVVNEWGRSHDVKNLFVVDGSIFVTSAGLNPTRTIQALSLYISDQIKQRLANLFD
jgi:choline dehydrogenase-like flavoprotein